MRHAATLSRLALRGVLREARRSVLTASAMALGLALLIVSRAIADGAHEDWVETGVRLASGHLAIQAPGFQESGSLDDRLTGQQVRDARVALESIEPRSEVMDVVSRLSVNGLASGPGSSVPTLILGVEPEAEGAFSRLSENVVEGRYLESDDRLAAYVGVRLVERLGLRVGSRFVLTAQSSDGEIAGQLMRVTGIFRTGIDELDEALVHIPIATAREWLVAPDAATTIAVLVSGSDRVEPVVEQLSERLAGAGVEVLPWTLTAPELDSAIRLDDYGDWTFHLILFAIVALAILNAVLMSVLYRKREFGILRALGLSAGETGALVFLEGLLLTACAGVAGMILGFSVTWIFWR
ncbi:MAG: ABC transporter permease, partial [Gemmatimonadota bacterium]|nr:ABC transporter permease [Gemmatimonadota bacterium]